MDKEIKDEKLNKGFEQIKKIKMTEDEKIRIFESIKNTPLPINQPPIKSPWAGYSFASSWHKNKVTYYVVISCLIIILSGREIVSASEDSLPGDKLYTIKVGIVEPIRTALTFSSESKIKYESSLSTKRLAEVEKLVSQNKLDDKKKEQVSSLVENNTKSLKKEIEKISKGKSESEVDKNVRADFEVGISTNSKVLKITKPEKDNNPSQIKTKEGNDEKNNSNNKGGSSGDNDQKNKQ